MRVLKRGGVLFVKCQSYVGNKPRMTHADLMTVLPLLGFSMEDEFVLMTTARPVMRHEHQRHARKNHSCLLVARLAR